MSRSKRHDLFVIFAGPQQYGRPGTRYYTQGAIVTQFKAMAAKFYSFEEAKEFAERNNIERTAMTYIGLDGFSASELSRD